MKTKQEILKQNHIMIEQFEDDYPHIVVYLYKSMEEYANQFKKEMPSDETIDKWFTDHNPMNKNSKAAFICKVMIKEALKHFNNV